MPDSLGEKFKLLERGGETKKKQADLEFIRPVRRYPLDKGWRRIKKQ